MERGSISFYYTTASIQLQNMNYYMDHFTSLFSTSTPFWRKKHNKFYAVTKRTLDPNKWGQIKEDMHDPSSIKAKAISSPQASIGFVVTKKLCIQNQYYANHIYVPASQWEKSILIVCVSSFPYWSKLRCCVGLNFDASHKNVACLYLKLLHPYLQRKAAMGYQNELIIFPSQKSCE